MSSSRYEVDNFSVAEEGVPKGRESRALCCYIVQLHVLDADQESWMHSDRSAMTKVEEWPMVVANC